MNESGLRPMEFNVVIRMDPVSDKIGNIFVPTAKTERDELAADEGTLVAVSPHAFTYADWPEGVVPPQVGDRVLFAIYEGRLWKKGDVTYRLVKDKSIVAVIEQPATLAAAA